MVAVGSYVGYCKTVSSDFELHIVCMPWVLNGMRVFSGFAWGVHRKYRAERQRLFLSVQSVVLPKWAHPEISCSVGCKRKQEKIGQKPTDKPC